MNTMTQEQFYDWANIAIPYNGPDSKHLRLIKDLRDKDYSWEQITEIFAQMFEGPYRLDW